MFLWVGIPSIFFWKFCSMHWWFLSFWKYSFRKINILFMIFFFRFLCCLLLELLPSNVGPSWFIFTLLNFYLTFYLTHILLPFKMLLLLHYPLLFFWESKCVLARNVHIFPHFDFSVVFSFLFKIFICVYVWVCVRECSLKHFYWLTCKFNWFSALLFFFFNDLLKLFKEITLIYFQSGSIKWDLVHLFPW